MNFDRIPGAAKRAFTDPVVLTSAIGAGLYSISDFDEKTVDWAVKHNPVFGSDNGAGDASDLLRTILQTEALSTTVLTPSGDDPKRWALAKAQGFAAEGLTLLGTQWVTDGIKSATKRDRPFEESDNSFPSAHSSVAFAAATLANRNLENIAMPMPLRRSLQATNLLLATGTAWARVEAGKHFPSDVLAGAALGRILAIFMHDVFLGLPADSNVEIHAHANKEGVLLGLHFRF